MSFDLGGPLILVGAGKMGGAMLRGWLARGLNPTSVYIQDPWPGDDMKALAEEKGISLGASADAAPADPAVVVIAVKPQVMDDVLPGLKGLPGKNTVVLSIAAGKTIASIASHLGQDCAIVRSMPNTPAAIGRGITVACPNARVSKAQRDMCDALLQAAGVVGWTDREDDLDPVTAVSGSGPAYVFLLVECLEEAGVRAGLERNLARQLARETVSGAGELLNQSDEDAAALRQNVTSPGGTTAAALDILMGPEGLEELMVRAVEAATIRSRELSN